MRTLPLHDHRGLHTQARRTLDLPILRHTHPGITKNPYLTFQGTSQFPTGEPVGLNRPFHFQAHHHRDSTHGTPPTLNQKQGYTGTFSHQFHMGIASPQVHPFSLKAYPDRRRERESDPLTHSQVQHRGGSA